MPCRGRVSRRCPPLDPFSRSPRFTLFDTAHGHLRCRPSRPPAAPPRAIFVFPRHHTVRRHAHRPRRDVRRLRPAQPGLAQRRPRGRLRPERHRRRRPAARARDQGRCRLDRAGRARDRAVPPGHGPRCGCCRPTHYIGAVESIRSRSSLIERLAGRRRGLPGRHRPLLLRQRRPGLRPGVGPEPRGRMLPLFGERGGDPDREGKKDPTEDCVVWRGPRDGEPSWFELGGRGPARLAHRVRRHRHGAPRRRLRRPGWRLRPGLPAPRDVRRPRPGRRPSGTPFAKLYSHAGMVAYDGEKMSKSQGQPGLRLRAPQQRRRPDGDPAGAAAPPLPLRLGVGRRRALGRRRHARRVAPGAVPRRRRPRAARSSPRCWPRWPTTSTPRARWPPCRPGSTPRSAAPGTSPTPPTTTPRSQMHALLDAALGLAL